MAPKKKDGEAPKKKLKPPPGMTEELFALSQNLPKLQEFWSGDIKESKGKAGEKPPPNITRTQAGLFILQQLFPNNKAARERREESIKLGIVETSIKVLASQKPADMVSAAHILAVMADNLDQSRQVVIDGKPSVIPQLLAGLSTQESAPLRTALCALMRVLAKHSDTRMRLWRQLKEWEWSHLISCLSLQELSQLGGRNAVHDAMAVLDSMCSAPEANGDVATQCCTHVINAGGLQAVVEVLQRRSTHPMAKALGVSVLNQIIKRAPASVCEEVMISARGLQPVVALLSQPIVPLLYKAHAAAVLLRFVLPDSLWKNSSMMPGGSLRPKTAGVATATNATTDLVGTQLEGMSLGGAAPAGGAEGQQLGVNTQQEGAAVGGGENGSATVAVSGGVGGARAVTAATTTRPGTAMFQDPAISDDSLLDEATKAQIAERAKLVAQGGAIPPLVHLCVGPEGPLPDKEGQIGEGQGEGEATESKGGKGGKKKKKGGKKKKGKLEPGMAEVQTWASAVLRMISLDAEQRPAVVSAGAVRYLTPLLDSKVRQARWNARQTLINLSMGPEFLAHLQRYDVPAYIHGGNVPTRHYDRPFPPTGAADASCFKVPAHLEPVIAAAQKDIAARGTTGPGVTLGASGAKPPALKAKTLTRAAADPALA